MKHYQRCDRCFYWTKTGEEDSGLSSWEYAVGVCSAPNGAGKNVAGWRDCYKYRKNKPRPQPASGEKEMRE